ncbi:MAG: hypothetical protein RL259_1487, partial [Bacteroidota bacterium]
VRNELLESDPIIIQQIPDIINTTTQEFREIPSIDRTLAMKYKLELTAVQEWLTLTRWSQKQITKEALDKILKVLSDLKLVSKILPAEDYLSK